LNFCSNFVRYETDEGTKVKSNAYYKKALVPQYDNRGRKVGDEEMDVLVQEGSYSYLLPDGQMVVVQ
jgi:Insect cuticle protein